MASITVGGSTVTVDMIRGDYQQTKERVAISQAPGVDGFEAQKLGQGDSEFRFVCVHHGSTATVRTVMEAIMRKQGGVATIIDDWVTTHNYMLITHVSQANLTPFVVPGGSTDTRGECLVIGVKLEN